ncbi:MAG: potassium/proton antiporter [Lentisphaeria bacterium]|nr:potassium/proton antiporter [Lentisphaeria bacterium]
MDQFNSILAIISLLMLFCLLSSKISSFLNMPALLLFLAVGMLSGSEGPGKIVFSNVLQTNYIGLAAMAFILFSGGFDTDFKSARKVMRTGVILSTFGVFLTALCTGGFVYLISSWMGYVLSPAWCFLLGSVISSTDAAAVFSILRSRSVSLQGDLQGLLELESGSNDPMAAFLTVFLIGIVAEEASTDTAVAWSTYAKVLPIGFYKMAVGLLAGWLLGSFFAWLYNKIDFEYNGLYYVLGIVLVLLAYSGTELIKGNGFMAVYVAGITMGNKRFVFRNGVGRFFDGVAWMMQVILFMMLGLLATPSEVWDAKYLGLATALFLMLAARPLATYLCMLKSPFSWKERTLVSWVGLRGGAPIMLATFPLLANLKDSQLMFNIVFFIVITSVILQGMTIMPLAKFLRLSAPLQKSPRAPLAFEETGDNSSVSREVSVPESMTGMTLAQLSLPAGVLVLLIRRHDKFIVPRGDTPLCAGDVLTLMGGNDAMGESLQKFRENGI